MSITFSNLAFADVWRSLLRELYDDGNIVSPRGQQIREITAVTLEVEDAYSNILVCPQRDLNYRFMVAEWLWIWFGLDDVKTISQYNSKIAMFSDDGLRFAGAYGPRVKQQFPYVVDRLTKDIDSRQAIIEIYQEPGTAPTKDVPCTLSVQFLVRDNKLQTIVCMRSSDVWLGLPYDFFNFSMIANILGSVLHVPLSSMIYHLGSSHLYEKNVETAYHVLYPEDISSLDSPRLSEPPSEALGEILQDLNAPIILGSSIYQQYAQILRSPRALALQLLSELI